MTPPKYSRLATTLLDEHPPLEESYDDSARTRAIGRMEEAMRADARARRRRIAVWSSGLAAAAVALAVFGGACLRRRPINAATNAKTPPSSVTATALALGATATLEHAGQRTSFDDATTIVIGDRVVAATSARAAISLSTGTHLTLDPGTLLDVVEQSRSQVYAISAGALQADVAKVPKDGRFAIRAGDAEVEVRGTSFRVAIVPSDPSCGEGTPTRVAVREGVVVVRRRGVEERVSAGESWPRGCKTPSVPASAAPSVAAGVPAPSIAPSKSALAPSELSGQNDLFDAATTARRRGDAAGAIAGYDRFLAKYPASPLAENARVERMRLLATSDHARAVTAADDYLAHHPNGFAKQEALALAPRSW
jgi:hypothetical protein